MARWKRMVIWMFAVGLAALLLQPASGLAAGKKPPAPMEGTPASQPHFGYGSLSFGSFTIQSTQYLQSGETFIGASGTRVTVSGNTQAYTAVDTIAIDLYLQKWDAAQGRWTDVAYVGQFKDYASSFVYGAKDLYVTGGYYYRTRGVHWVNEAGVIEQGGSVSTYIYVQ
ncbi:DUF6147 family protein [Effusibacillus pohliae]|uniref:DUF6147 family protein n=1 Tax=Effusibacillus pohliae TaxID=232270 RepID=UPI00036751FA|nr:DUF6147 family protein [Effusibacillus pohliae]